MVWVKKHITKEMCLDAMSKTQSIKAAARYLNCCYKHLKPFMQSYIDDKTGKTLFELHKNQSGKGIPKFLSADKETKNRTSIIKVLNGSVDASHFTTEKLKEKLLYSGLVESCCSMCKFAEKRLVDGKIPLLIHFRDGIKNHFTLSNIAFYCYNCYFLYYGRVFSGEDLREIEDGVPAHRSTDRVDMELSDYHRKTLEELGLGVIKVEGDPYDLVSRKK
jgi:hypothetical protein